MQVALQAKPATKVGVFRDLHGRQNEFEYDATSDIDPDVVIDEPERVRIGTHTTLRKGVVLRPETGEIAIGDHCTINHYCVFHGKGGLHIGDWTIFGPNCGIFAQNHSFGSFELPITRQLNVGRGVYLMGDNWIGAHSVICDDVTLGKGAVVGANATVTRSVPMGWVTAGSPARIIQKRNDGPWDFRKVERAVWSDDMPADNHAWVRARAKRLAGLLKPSDHVLEIGCGEGLVAAVLAQNCERLVGCDYSAAAVKTARKSVPNAEFAYSNATHLRFSDASFSAVVMSDVAEHLLPAQFEHSLREVCRVLAPGGRVIIATPPTGSGTNTSTYCHIYEYSPEELNALLEPLFTDVTYVDQKFGVFVGQVRAGSSY